VCECVSECECVAPQNFGPNFHAFSVFWAQRAWGFVLSGMDPTRDEDIL
jgi:hypothetical protein